MPKCPCSSEKSYEQCCEPIHKGELAKTAKQLMQARYSAFCKHNIDFIAKTHIPGTEDFDADEAKAWATTSTWKKLEIIKTVQGQEENDKGIVEFKAYYADQEGNDFCHHEISNFQKTDGIWYYVDGQIVGSGPLRRSTPKVGRNEPCPCGSGKKFKKCCGAI